MNRYVFLLSLKFKCYCALLSGGGSSTDVCIHIISNNIEVYDESVPLGEEKNPVPGPAILETDEENGLIRKFVLNTPDQKPAFSVFRLQ